MGIRVQWDNRQQTIILMTFEGRWVWRELQEAVLVCNEMIESVPHHVHFILDRHGGLWTPGNLLVNMRKIIDLFTPNDGYRMIVGDNPLIKEMLSLYSRINADSGFRYRYANSVNEARTFLGNQPIVSRNADSFS